MDITIPYYEDNSRISNSSLGWFKSSPNYFWKRLNGEIEGLTTSNMEFGTMVHMYLLQPEEFKRTYKVKDIEIPSSSQQKQFCQDYIKSKASTARLKAVDAFKSNYSTSGKSEDKIAAEALKMALNVKPYIQYLRSEKSTDGKKFVSWSQYRSLKAMKENVQLHKLANELLYKTDHQENVDAHNEFHINWEYPNKFQDYQILCKSLIDRILFNHTDKTITLIDIKTTSNVNDFRHSFDSFDYGRQMAFYWLAIYWYCKYELHIDPNILDEYKLTTNIVAIQTSGTFECKVFKIEGTTIDIKITEIDDIISDLSWHYKNNLWEYKREYYEGDGSEPLL